MDKEKFYRLHEAVEWSIKKLETPRKNRLDAVRLLVGYHYTDNGSDKRMPTNLLELATTIYCHLLAAHAPQCVVSTPIPSLRPMAADMEAALNQVPGEINLSATFRRVVTEALFSLGIVKTGIYFNGKLVEDEPDSEPYVDLVDFDDYFVDMSARSWPEIQFEGNEYMLDIDQAKRLFGKKDLVPDEITPVSPSGQDQTRSISQDETAVSFHDRIILRDVYLCKEGRLVTYAVGTQQILRDVPWDGPEGTPYIKLWFSEVPGQLLPLPTIANWRDLHELANSLFRKLGRQAEAKKLVAAFPGGNDDDVQRLQQADDGDGIRVSGQHPDMISLGGIDQPTLAMFLQIKDIFNTVTGNIDSLGGLSRQSETATQDRLINESASVRIQSMSERVTEFARAIFKRLAWYVWTDPVRTRKITKTIGGGAFGITKAWTPETRDGDFLDFNFDINVFSMQDKSPATKIQNLRTMFNDFLLPLMQQFQAQGAQIDLEMLCDILAQNADLPELKQLILFPNPTIAPQQPRGNPQPDYVSTKSPVTHHVYERVGRPGATRAGRDAVMSQLLLGGKAQDSQAAQLGGAL